MKIEVLAGFATVLMVFCSCNSNDVTSASISNPTKTTREFFTALSNKDFNTAKKNVSKESETFLDMLDSFYQKNKKADFVKLNKFVVEDVHVNGDSAFADVKTMNDSVPMKVNLVKEAGEWKVAFDMNELMKNAMDDSLQKKNRNIDYDIHKGIDSVRRGL